MSAKHNFALSIMEQAHKTDMNVGELVESMAMVAAFCMSRVIEVEPDIRQIVFDMIDVQYRNVDRFMKREQEKETQNEPTEH